MGREAPEVGRAERVTDSVGHYAFTGLNDGNYSVEVVGNATNAGDETAVIGVSGEQAIGSIGLPGALTQVNQAKPMATGKRDGIDWSTLDIAKGTVNVIASTNGNVSGKNFGSSEIRVLFH